MKQGTLAASNFTFVEPMKALSVQALPVGKWLYEVKLDGYRALAFKSGKATRLVSRNQKAFNYPELLDALKSLRAEHFVIDGEITALDPKGRSSFQLLQAYERAALGCFFMKVITLILIVFSVMARAEGEGVEFYFSKMRWSSNQDPVDAGAIDGAYYADLMASHGVRKVGFDLVDAKEMRNPRWNSKTPDDMEAAEYALSFTFGFNYEAANRGMIAPSGDPYRNEGKTPQELTLETEHWANRHARGEVDQPTPTPTPGPVTSTLVPMPKEMQDKIKAEEIAKEEQRRKLFEKQEAEREANGDFSQAPGLTAAQREAAEIRWAEKNAKESIRGAKPAPQ